MNDFKRLSLDELCDRLCEVKKTIIIYHVRSDADAVGSAFALRELLKIMGSPVICLCSDEVPERLRFLSEDAQGSVIADEDMGFGHERVISVDSASPSQLGDLFLRLRRDVDIMIDHHAHGIVYADNYIEPDASATGEIIYKIAKNLLARGIIDAIPPRAIDCIYAAISADTGGFKYSNTTSDTHRAAAELIDAGANAAEINRLLFNSKSIKLLSVEAYALKTLKIYLDGRVASVSMPFSAKSALGVEDEHLDTMIEIPRSVEGVEIALSVRQSSSAPCFRISMRSCTDFDVSKICTCFGGGGHVRAAACTVEAESIESAISKVLTEIKRYI